MLNPIWLKTFTTVAACHSFTEAGRQLDLTQSSVSEHIRRLEESVGRRLFVRDTHSLAMTPDGEAMLAHASVILQALARAESQFRAPRLKGRVRLGSSDDVALGPLPTVLGETQAPPFDFVGCGLLSLCMIAFSLAVDAPVPSHRLAWSAGLFALAVVSALAYIPHARRRSNPLFKLALFREPNFSVGLIGNLVCRVGSSAVPFLVPLLLQLQLGYTPLHSGLMMLPAALAGTLTKRWIAPLVRRYGYDTFLLVNTVIVGSSIVALALITRGTPLIVGIVILAVFGGANSMQFAAMNSVTLKGLSHEDAGSGNSLFSMVQMLAIGLGVSIGGGLVNLFSAQWGSAALGFRLSFVCVGVITLVSAWIFRHLDEAPVTREVRGQATQGAGR